MTDFWIKPISWQSRRYRLSTRISKLKAQSKQVWERREKVWTGPPTDRRARRLYSLTTKCSNLWISYGRLEIRRDELLLAYYWKAPRQTRKRHA